MTKEPFWPWDEGYDDIPEYDDAADVHDERHPWVFAGCKDCVERAYWLEANR